MAQHGPGPDPTCFIAFPTSSAIWLALMDSTCTFQILCAWNRERRRRGRTMAVWPHPPWDFFGWWRLTENQGTQNNSIRITAVISQQRNSCDVMIDELFALQLFLPFVSLCSESESKPWWIIKLWLCCDYVTIFKTKRARSSRMKKKTDKSREMTVRLEECFTKTWVFRICEVSNSSFF